MQRFVDAHTHSEFSPDSTTSVEALLVKAQEVNALGVVFTDHIDLDAPRTPGKFVFSIADQQKKIEETAWRIFPNGECKALKGIEIGLQPCSIEHSRDFIAGCNFDQIIASVHFVDGEDPYYGNYYDNKDYLQAYGRVLELIYQTAVEFKDFDVIGHFDYVARYSRYQVRDLRYADFPDHLDMLLGYLAREGKALEINTKTYSLHTDHVQELDKNILLRFKELGGEFVTLGSDAHSAARLTDNFSKFAAVCATCGFPKLTYFQNRKPVLY